VAVNRTFPRPPTRGAADVTDTATNINEDRDVQSVVMIQYPTLETVLLSWHVECLHFGDGGCGVLKFIVLPSFLNYYINILPLLLN
jgi:hypothetical protein